MSNHLTWWVLCSSRYGSPNTQLVTYEYETGWEHYQSSANDLIIAYVDGRGSGGRGDDWLFSVHKRLGTVDVEDTLTAARWVDRDSKTSVE